MAFPMETERGPGDACHIWQVFLGEVHSGVSGTQVVVKELKVSASVQEQMQFLEEAQPYRALQHSNLLQCLAQCAEVTPYLLVMEFCPLGDLKGYLRSCRVTESMAPDPLTLQRMACEVACGVLHLHRHNYVHSDLALRNCLLTADLTVKVGDYGLSHCKYREDYLVTADQLWVPLRWIAPELVDEVHGNLLVVDQTKSSNVWSLGVTIWELFELGAQPYPQHSDGQVLAYAVREQQLKLPKPQLQLALSDRWAPQNWRRSLSGAGAPCGPGAARAWARVLQPQQLPPPPPRSSPLPRLSRCWSGSPATAFTWTVMTC